MHQSPLNSSPPPAAPRSLNRNARFLTQTLTGRLLLSAIIVGVLYAGVVWYTKYRGTGWSQTFNLNLWYRRNRGEDLYHSKEALLVHGNRKVPEVALTFDDGPHPMSRGSLLDTLKRYGVHATFFDVGSNMGRCPALVERTLREGHEVANHTDHHVNLTGISSQERRREINDADIEFCSITGKHLKLLRPPGMRINSAVQKEIRDLGYVTVAYTTAAKDADASDPAPADIIVDRTLSRIENGTILLLHDYPTTAEALPRIVETLRKRGFRCVTVSEMLDHLPEPVRTDSHTQVTSTP